MAQSPLYDTHCHLDLLPDDRLSAVMARAFAVGVTHFVVPGVTCEGWRGIAELAKREQSVLPAFGLHPFLAHLFRPELLTALSGYLPQAVAVGEIGLDYLAPEPSRGMQQTAFRSQLRLAVEAGLPVLIHCRKAFQDMLAILREERVQRVGGVMHAFSGSPETAEACIRLGLFIGVAGTVTYRNAVRPVEVVRRIPLEYLVLETDAPDITPEPYRGRDNEPSFIRETAQRVATVKGVDLATVAKVTSQSATSLFGLRSPAIGVQS